MNATTVADGTEHAVRNKLVINLLLVSSFVVILNETIMSVAIPPLMASLGVTAAAAQWVTTAFLLTMAVVIPMTGFLLQRLHTRADIHPRDVAVLIRHAERPRSRRVSSCSSSRA